MIQPRARRLRRDDARRLLPVLRGRDGADAPLPRHPRPRRGRLRRAGPTTRRQHVWTVTDHEAHAWVEVWFRGYGWLPFDPTPAAPGAAPRQTQAGLTRGGRRRRRASVSVCGRLGRLVPPRARLAARAKLIGDSECGRLASARLGAGFDRGVAAAAAASQPAGAASARRSSPRPWERIVADEARLPPDAQRSPRPAPRRRSLQAGARRVPPRPADRGAAQRDAARARCARPARVRGRVPRPFVAAATAARFGPARERGPCGRTARRELRTPPRGRAARPHPAAIGSAASSRSARSASRVRLATER